MSYFMIGLESKELGGIRHFCMLEATDVVDAIMKFQPKLDSMNDQIRKGLCEECREDLGDAAPLTIRSIDKTDHVIYSEEWANDVVNEILSGIALAHAVEEEGDD